MPGVPDALARLQAQGLRLVVVSNSDGTVEQSLIEAGLRPYMTHVVDSALAGYEKPDPRIFLHALAHTGAVAGRTLHIGDLYHADVLGARAPGCTRSCWIRTTTGAISTVAVARHLTEVADVMAATRA